MVKQATRVISMRLPSRSSDRLKKMARHHGWTVSDTSARLVEEGLRQNEFAQIDFRDSPVGRQAYVKGSGLAVWEVKMVARSYKYDVAKTAKHLNWPDWWVKAAFNYWEAFRKEIDTALKENDEMDFDAIKRMLPNAQEFIVGKD